MEMSDTDCGFPGEERQEREAVCSFYSILVILLLLIGGVECNPGPLNQSNEVILFNRFIFTFLYRLLYTYGIHHLHLWREILVWNLSVVKDMSPVHCPFFAITPPGYEISCQKPSVTVWITRCAVQFHHSFFLDSNSPLWKPWSP